jgi:mono/diheme cytochrome c family protein
MLIPVAACKNEPKSDSGLPMSPIVAAGSRGDELYQAHCAACHGRDGRGDGIARTFIGVTPRDFWHEPFRYVSTLDGTATEQDLIQTIRWGRLPGQMPAAPWLSDEDVVVLAEYVRELNRLGWVDRLGLEFKDEAMSTAEIEEIATERVTPAEVVSVPMPQPGFRPDLQIGREVYMAGCASCHGPAGRGDGLEMPLDELGRPIKVRDLTRAPIQGGSDPIELFKRIRCGVPGTPMPAQEALTDEQVWQLVYYTRFLAGRPLQR